MDLLKPWISATVSAALKSCSYARSATKDGELVIPRDKESVAQLISVCRPNGDALRWRVANPPVLP